MINKLREQLKTYFVGKEDTMLSKREIDAILQARKNDCTQSE